MLSSIHISLPLRCPLSRATFLHLKILMSLTEGNSEDKRPHCPLHLLVDQLGWELMVNGPQALLGEYPPQIQRKVEFHKQLALVTGITCTHRPDPLMTVVCLTQSTATSERPPVSLTATFRHGNGMQTYHPSRRPLLTLNGKLVPVGVEAPAKIAGVIGPRYPEEVGV